MGYFMALLKLLLSVAGPKVALDVFDIVFYSAFQLWSGRWSRIDKKAVVLGKPEVHTVYNRIGERGLQHSRLQI